MDKATLIGISSGIACVVISVGFGATNEFFFDKMSMVIVLGGGLASTFISYRLSEILSVFKVVRNIFTDSTIQPVQTIKQLVELSSLARKEGLLSLEEKMGGLDNEFMSKSIQLIVDGLEPNMVKDVMLMELESMKNRHSKGQGIFKTMGALFPAWGMIGTLIGLIALLAQLNDPSTIGPSMAIALVTTFYGSVLANLFCLPIASKLAQKSKEEILYKEMVLEGVLSIQAGDNPRIIEQKLITYLSVKEKKEYFNVNREKTAEEQLVSNTLGNQFN